MTFVVVLFLNVLIARWKSLLLKVSFVEVEFFFHLKFDFACVLFEDIYCIVFSFAMFHIQCWSKTRLGPYEKVCCSIWRKIYFSININIGRRLCPSLKCWSHCVLEFDSPALHTLLFFFCSSSSAVNARHPPLLLPSLSPSLSSSPLPCPLVSASAPSSFYDAPPPPHGVTHLPHPLPPLSLSSLFL